jgi:tetratricopeptide (TPR) repeat protein
MRTRAIVPGILAALLAVGLLGGAGPAPAAAGTQETRPSAETPDWFELYRRAVAGAELESWEEVEATVRRAIRLNPKPARNVRTYGMWHASYIPYYYLGLAQYRLGRHEEALRNFAKEEAAGAVQHDPIAYLKLKKIVASIKVDPARAPDPAGPAPQAAAGPSEDGVMDGLQAFFRGDYDQSIASFQETMKRSPEDDLTLHLYLGMAYAGKASEESAQRQLWRNMAFLEFQRVHAIDPDYVLAPGVFSDEMVKLFKGAGSTSP